MVAVAGVVSFISPGPQTEAPIPGLLWRTSVSTASPCSRLRVWPLNGPGARAPGQAHRGFVGFLSSLFIVLMEMVAEAHPCRWRGAETSPPQGRRVQEFWARCKTSHSSCGLDTLIFTSRLRSSLWSSVSGAHPHGLFEGALPSSRSVSCSLWV